MLIMSMMAAQKRPFGALGLGCRGAKDPPKQMATARLYVYADMPAHHYEKRSCYYCANNSLYDQFWALIMMASLAAS